MRSNIVSLIHCDYPLNYALGFQDPATNWMYAIIDLHDKIIFFLLILLVVVSWFQVSAQTNKDHQSNLHHGNLIEQIWTITPAGILWAIGQPSLKLLYSIDEILDAELTVKAIANQWYFYAINRASFFANRNKILKAHGSSIPLIKLDPNWVTGFTDAEGCFSINIQERLRRETSGDEVATQSISSTFKIALDYKDIQILYALKDFFSVGQITIHKNEARLEIMGYSNLIDYVIPHFDKYPQLTDKYADYVQWKNIILLQRDRKNLQTQGFIQCLALKASLNKGLNERLKTLYPDIKPVIRPKKEAAAPKALLPHWQSGFTAGDGSFMVIIRKSKTCRIGYQIQLAFNIGQHVKDVLQLYKIKEFLGCGEVYTRKKDSRIVVVKQSDIRERIIPHFTSFPLMNAKQKSFLIWCEIAELQRVEPLNEALLTKIRKRREEM